MPSKNKLSPDIVKMICVASVKLNGEEKTLANHIIRDYGNFFINGRFKNFDKYLSTIYEHSDNKDKIIYFSNSLILLACFGLTNELFGSYREFTIEMLENYVKYDKTPFAGIKSRLNVILLGCTRDITSNANLCKFIFISSKTELPSLPEELKKHFTFHTSSNDFNKDKSLITFIKRPSFNMIESYLDRSYSHLVIITTSGDSNNVAINAKYFLIDNENKKISSRSHKINVSYGFC